MKAAGLLALMLTLPALAAEPKFAAVVDAETYPSVAAPAEAPLFRWDFSAKRDYRFAYEQTTEAGTSFGGDATPTNARGTGSLVVRSNGDGTAKLVFENVRVAMDAKDRKPVTQSMPSMVAGTITENSRITTQQSSLQILFPLPPAALGVGESVDVPFEMPFNASGSMLQAKGTSHIRHTGYVMLGKRLCARLENRAEIVKIEVPEEVPGKYELTLNATGVYFFDVQERRFVRGVSASRIAMSADVPMPKFEDAPASANVPERQKIAMTSEERITLSIAE